jgi:glycosyltransferase involved in cell wall biosynthesis
MFTVFTPTYDRAPTLSRVYESLRAQTMRDFEWLIIDDGSTDGTDAMVEAWQAIADFPIRYVRQSNSGKHIAFARAVAIANGDLLLTLDSDDACTPDALARLRYHWEAIPVEVRARYVSVTGLCVDQHGRIVGDRFPADVLDSDPVELAYRYHVHGEKWGFSRVDVLRAYPLESSVVTRFMPESIVWDAIGSRYRTRYVNEILRIYWIRDESRPDPSDAERHAPGLATWHRSILNRHIRWFRYAPMAFVLSAVHYVRFSAHIHDGPTAQLHSLHPVSARLLWAFALPAGYLVYARDRLRMATDRRRGEG